VQPQLSSIEGVGSIDQTAAENGRASVDASRLAATVSAGEVKPGPCATKQRYPGRASQQAKGAMW